MHRLDLDLQRLHQAGQARGLSGRKLEDEPAEYGGVDDRVLKRPRQAPAEDPGVEGVVAVLDQDGSPGEVEEGAAGVGELGRVNEHLPLDQVPALGVGVDRGASVDQGVEEPERTAEPKPLGTDLEDQERAVAGGLDVDRDELSLLEGGVGVDGREIVLAIGLLPGDQLGGAARLQAKQALGKA
jgi:hypothetical protein